jgi:hypothetical protein
VQHDELLPSPAVGAGSQIGGFATSGPTDPAGPHHGRVRGERLDVAVVPAEIQGEVVGHAFHE